MPNAQRIAVEGKGNLQLLVEVIRDVLLGDVERNGQVMLGKIFLQVGLCLFQIGDDSLHRLEFTFRLVMLRIGMDKK